MKPEDRKRLKWFWLMKGLLLTSFIGSVGISVIMTPFLQSQYAMFQETEVSTVLNASSGREWEDLDRSDSSIPWTRTALSLGHLERKTAIPILIGRLSNKNAYVRANAAFQLIQLGDKTAVPILIEGLSNKNAYIRTNAAFALGQLDDKTVIPFLLKLLNDSDSDVRTNAALSLGQLGDKRAFPFKSFA